MGWRVERVWELTAQLTQRAELDSRMIVSG